MKGQTEPVPNLAELSTESQFGLLYRTRYTLSELCGQSCI